MANKTLIKVNDLSKVYKDGSDDIVALDDVSFTVAQGESLAVIGPSGSGKTTLLELIAGLNDPTVGEVFIDGKNVHEGSDKEISEFRNTTMGFVFQMMHLQDYFTAVENVSLPLIASGMSFEEAEERAYHLLEKVGLKNRTGHYPSQMSGGEMQRVAIARALANEPKMILADEPTGKLDRKNADMVLDIFQDIAKEGVTVIVITHDLSIAKKLGRSIKLEDGRLAK